MALSTYHQFLASGLMMAPPAVTAGTTLLGHSSPVTPRAAAPAWVLHVSGAESTGPFPTKACWAAEHPTLEGGDMNVLPRLPQVFVFGAALSLFRIRI